MAENNSKRNDLTRAHVWVTGRVQGVGFRAFVSYNAQRLEVTGWVRNLGYDTVEALVEGGRAQIEQFVQIMKAGPNGAHVDESRLEEETHTGEFADFQIRASG
jgi:acylphosphatase